MSSIMEHLNDNMAKQFGTVNTMCADGTPKCELAIMDPSGDIKTLWDPDNKDEAEHAKETFDKFKKKGFMIYAVDDKGDRAKVMHTFDPKARKMIAVPPVQGG